MAKRIIDARVRQKAAPLEEWNNSNLDSLDGEQLFVRSDVDDAVIGFKLGAKNKKFSELPYPDFTVRGKVSTTSTWTGRQSGIYIPTTNGNYNGVQVNLTEGYQVLYWDGSTVEKVVYPNDYVGAVFGGVIDDTYDLSNPTEPIWYIASPGTYNTVPSITLTENSILTWNGQSWSHIPFELEVRGEFLVADNIQEVRNITPDVASLLVNGTYKGVTVLGYDEPNDTPSPINYYVSDTLLSDNGGSVLEGGGIKLEHNFNGSIDVSYFGAKGDFTGNISNPYTDNHTFIQNAINSIIKGEILFGKGAYAFSKTLEIPTVDSGTNSAEIIFKSKGKLSSGGTLFQASSGIVQLNFVGQTDVRAINSSSLQTWIDIQNIGLVNNSGRNDVDGLVMNDYRSNRMTNFSAILFRDNISIDGDTYYTIFDKCSFTHAKRNNVYLNRLANMTSFIGCRISLSESVGLRAPQIGDGINIVNSFIEGNKGAGIYVNNCRLLNVSGCYIENNAAVGEVLSGVRSQVIIGAYTNNINTPTKATFNNNYVMTVGDGCDFIYALHTNSATIGNINVSIIENTIPATLITKDISATDRTHLVRCNYPAYLEFYVDNNKYSYTSKTKMYYPVNSRPSILASFYSNNDDSVTFLRPEWNRAIFSKNTTERGLVTNKISYVSPQVLGDGSNKDTSFDVDVDAPDLSTANMNLREFRFTNTTGNLIKQSYNGNTTTPQLMFEQDCKSGLFYSRGGLKIGDSSLNVRILTGLATPNGNYFASRGSIYLYQGTTTTGIYFKTTDNASNTGWVLIPTAP
ncbi:MAG TPA: right-handed parallel beta-helix repeat-containing protein [Ureibacillus sp.]|nr:right-handed parallel beta-helix repeat-containing protein [Ureibacillus sp.]